MGKVQSKPGECYVVNAHFNPICQMDEDPQRQKPDLTQASQDNDVQLCSDLLSVCDINKPAADNDCIQTKCPLQAILPPEGTEAGNKQIEMEKPEKAEEEKSEKEEKHLKNLVECDMSVDDLEKQEFSFTLYNFDSHEAVRDERAVVRSIYDVVKNSLKLPPSALASRTLKVHLAISPHGSTDETSQERSYAHDSNTGCDQQNSSPTKASSNPVASCSHSVNTSSTYLASSSPSKELDTPTKCCQHTTDTPKQLRFSSPEVRGTASPSPRPRRSCRSVSLQRQEMMRLLGGNMDKSCQDHFEDARHHQCSRECGFEHRRHHHRRDRHGHYYLDLAGTEECFSTKGHNLMSTSNDPRHVNPAYCSPRVMDKAHMCSRSHRSRDLTDHHCSKKTPHNSHQRLQDPEINSQLLKSKLLQEAKGNLLNCSFDQYDLEQDDKYEWEPYHHRRSKSYDIHDNLGNTSNVLTSSKLRHHGKSLVVNTTLASQLNGQIPASPSRHHKHRHREREKDRQRAMQQVANWIEKEHLGTSSHDERTSHFVSNGISNPRSELVVERHEHHHHHEHVHHHYHHYVDS